VFGILKGRTVDVERCRYLVEKAQVPCTFHRAFDQIAEEDMLKELEVLINCGFKSVLTSGGKENAVKGSTMLRQLVEAAGGRIDVIIGGGVRSDNLQALKTDTGGRTFHSSAIIGGGENANKEEVERIKSITK